MKNKKKNKTLEMIGHLYERTDGCALSDEFLEEVREEASGLAEYFQVSEVQALLLSVMFAIQYDNGRISFSELVRHFRCSPIRMLEFSDDIEALIEKGLVYKQRQDRSEFVTNTRRHQYILNEQLQEAIIRDKPLPEVKQQDQEFKDIFDLLNQVCVMYHEQIDRDVPAMDMFRDFEEMLRSNSHFTLVSKVLAMKLDYVDAFIYLNLVWATLNGKSSIELEDIARPLVPVTAARVRFIQQFMHGENQLIADDLCTLKEDSFFNEAELALTSHSFDIMASCGLKISTDSKTRKGNILEPSAIPGQTLVYSDQEKALVTRLRELMRDDHLGDIRTRLQDKGMPTGITIMLHGAPGTGKTETALQLARTSERELIRVDISKAKSMWFGNSEKNIKRIFLDYKAYAEQCDKLPILLFNEADALLSRRRAVVDRQVSQTENAIQNILLEELEHFSGILVATTNLTNNLDAAFERRFLFKVRFSKPGLEARARIWKLKLPGFGDAACAELARLFPFSGAEINNVARKMEIEEVIYGREISLDDIKGFCREEHLQEEKPSMGFEWAR